MPRCEYPDNDQKVAEFVMGVMPRPVIPGSISATELQSSYLRAFDDERLQRVEEKLDQLITMLSGRTAGGIIIARTMEEALSNA